jgi:hypothetical protein
MNKNCAIATMLQKRDRLIGDECVSRFLRLQCAVYVTTWVNPSSSHKVMRIRLVEPGQMALFLNRAGRRDADFI